MVLRLVGFEALSRCLIELGVPGYLLSATLVGESVPDVCELAGNWPAL